MVGLFMITFTYQDHTHFANVIRYSQDPPACFISFITIVRGMPAKLLLIKRNDQFVLSKLSPNHASEDLVSLISQRIMAKLQENVM